MPAIPPDNLSYPILIRLENGSTGSGFFLNGRKFTYVITAKHVLYGQEGRLLVNTATLISYGVNPTDRSHKRVTVDLTTLTRSGHIYLNDKRDVAAFLYGSVVNETRDLQLIPGIQLIEQANSKTAGIRADSIKKYNEVSISNDVWLFGYPSSIGLQESPQFDYSMPLLRKGIVAGKYDAAQTILLDCPSYYGNSGGPVIESEEVYDERGLGVSYYLIGVLVEFIPYVEKWRNSKSNIENIEFMNSGYSVAVSMNAVLEILDLT